MLESPAKTTQDVTWTKDNKTPSPCKYILNIIPFPSFSLPDVLCEPNDFISREGTPYEAMTDLTAFIDDLLAEVFLGCKVNFRRSVPSARYHRHH